MVGSTENVNMSMIQSREFQCSQRTVNTDQSIRPQFYREVKKNQRQSMKLEEEYEPFPGQSLRVLQRMPYPHPCCDTQELRRDLQALTGTFTHQSLFSASSQAHIIRRRLT